MYIHVVYCTCSTGVYVCINCLLRRKRRLRKKPTSAICEVVMEKKDCGEYPMDQLGPEAGVPVCDKDAESIVDESLGWCVVDVSCVVDESLGWCIVDVSLGWCIVDISLGWCIVGVYYR